MNIVYDWPPGGIGARCTEAFGLLPDGVLFAFGDTIYYPNGCNHQQIPMALKAHEFTHSQQQGDDPEKWWDKYLTDPNFRLRQEVEAHRVEWIVVERSTADPNERAKYLHDMAARLSSPMYGKLVTFSEAKALIRGDS